MQYGKIIDEELVLFRNPIRVDGEDIFTNDPQKFGYKPVVYTDPPHEDGYIAVDDGWEDTGDEIVKRWRLEPEPEPEGDV